MVHTIESLLLSSKRKIVINSKKLESCKFSLIAVTTREINVSKEWTHYCYCLGGCYCNRTLESIATDPQFNFGDGRCVSKLIKLPTLMITMFLFCG
jgi:hypothetical protein